MRRAVVLGLMGRYPMGGMAWQVLHHVLGFERLGVECYYVENSGAPPYSPRRASIVDCARDNVRFLTETFARHGLAERWVYWDSLADAWHGLGKVKADALLRDADLVVNLCGASLPDPEHRRRGCLVYIETDPIFEQIKIASGDAGSRAFVEAHDVVFTYGTRIGEPGCPVPSGGIPWRRTLPPVIVDLWQSPPPEAGAWRTIATYRNRGKDVVVGGHTYRWSKHPSFERVMDLPRRTSQTLEIALATSGEEGVLERFAAHGWKLEDPLAVSSDEERYRAYIQGARGEFSVEKEDQTALKVGWFSDRSVCFLGSGRPCVLEDTGIGAAVPTGDGLITWSTQEEALEGLERVSRDHAHHCAAALRLAREYFEAGVVLAPILEAAGVRARR